MVVWRWGRRDRETGDAGSRRDVPNLPVQLASVLVTSGIALVLWYLFPRSCAASSDHPIHYSVGPRTQTLDATEWLPYYGN
jgi:hypothetical protein